MQLRSQNISNVADVEFAILETSGQLSVLHKDKNGNSGNSNESQKKTKSTKSLISMLKYESLPLPLIMDGKVQDENLEQIGKTRFWLKNQIQSKGIMEFKHVFYVLLIILAKYTSIRIRISNPKSCMTYRRNLPKNGTRFKSLKSINPIRPANNRYRVPDITEAAVSCIPREELITIS